MEIVDRGGHSGVGPLFKSGRFQRYSSVGASALNAEWGGRTSRAAFIVEQTVWRTLPSEQQQQFGNEFSLTLLLIHQGNAVGLLDAAVLGLFQ